MIHPGPIQMTDLSRREALLLGAGALAFAPTLAAAQAALPTKWDLTELFPTDAAWTAERAALQADFKKLAAFKGRLGESGAVLKQASQLVSDLNKRLGRFYIYASLMADEDQQVAANEEKRQIAVALASELGEATAWMNPELLAAGEARIMGFIDADPQMARFRYGASDLFRQAPHVLSVEGEALLAAAGNPLNGPSQIRGLLVAADMPYPEVESSKGKVRLDPQGYGVLRASPVRQERKAAMDGFFGTYKKYQTTLGAAQSAHVQGHIFNAKARKYGTSLEAALSGANIPTGVYKTLVAEANAGLPVLHRYFELRRRLLGLPDMHYYDIYPPVTKLDRKFDVAESRRISIAAFAPLGAEYVKLFTEASAKPWVHVYPQKGKRAGAYVNGSAYDVHPYMLLNHTDDYEGMSTYAHEWGHAMHTLLAMKAQPFELYGYATFTAEIASTVNEQLLVDHMLKGAKTKEEKLFYLDRLCETFRGTFYRQTMFAEFELAMHETAESGQPLSGQRLTAMYLDLLKKYHGPKLTIDPAYATEWAYIQHFFFNFYVYQYATCVSASVFFADRVLTGGTKGRDAYLDVLRAGGSADPVDVIRKGGLDMTTPAPYRALVAKFGRTLDEMEKLLGQG